MELTGFGKFTLGGLCGVLISILVTEALVEISLNGVTLQYLGIGIVFRVVYNHLDEWKQYQQNKRPKPRDEWTKIVPICVFAFLCFLSGIFCFVLDKNWVRALSPTAKVPLYMVVGMSLSFAFTFTLIDTINLYGKLCSRRSPSNFFSIKSSRQIFTAITSAIVGGIYFGFIFGTLDVEDDTSLNGVRFLEDKRYSVPAGFILGAIVGLNDSRELDNKTAYLDHRRYSKHRRDTMGTVSDGPGSISSGFDDEGLKNPIREIVDENNDDLTAMLNDARDYSLSLDQEDFKPVPIL